MKRGQILVEVIIAVAIALVALVGIVQVSNRSVSNSGASKRQAEATALGSEAMEWIAAQYQINNWDWNGFASHASAGGTTYCFSVSPPPSWPSSGACASATLGNPVEFTRTATLQRTGTNEVSINVTVAWNEGGRSVSSVQSRVVTRY